MAGKFRTFRGSTANGGSLILGSPFWEEGKSVTGIYIRSWPSSVGECHEFLVPPQTAKPKAWVSTDNRIVESGDAGAVEQELAKFSIGALTGFTMAWQDTNSALALANEPAIKFRDQLTVKCVGFQKATRRGNDDMPLFEIEVER